MLPIWIAATLLAQGAPEATASPQTYEAEFAPLERRERQYAWLGPAGPYYPERDLPDTSGDALIQCVAGPNGELQRCKSVSEKPYDSGFSIAARIMADRRRIKASGSPPEGQVILVHVPFKIGAPVAIKR